MINIVEMEIINGTSERNKCLEIDHYITKRIIASAQHDEIMRFTKLHFANKVQMITRLKDFYSHIVGDVICF